MVDTHYDLLTICYTCYLNNDYSKIEQYAEEIKNSGVKSIFANLYFMSEEQMKEELGLQYYRKDVSILGMFKIAKEILTKYLPDIDFIYSIEGCDYLDISELDDLYNEGLRSIVLVWNNKNRYGSGNRTDSGLTDEGIAFLNKAIDLGIGIDLSHANKATFNGMIDVIKTNQQMGKDVVCYASHSNARSLCDVARNLDDEQLDIIKEVNGLVGIVSFKLFVTQDTNLPNEFLQGKYLDHIMYVADKIGIDNVMLSTDDMRFCGDLDPEYYDLVLYNYSIISDSIYRLLRTKLNDQDANKILYENAYNKIINKLNNQLINKKR